MNIDSSLWLDKLKKETYQENTAEEPSKFIQHELCSFAMLCPNRLRRLREGREHCGKFLRLRSGGPKNGSTQ